MITSMESRHCKRDWSRLPDDIIAAISTRLTVIDYFAMTKVCTSWNSVISPLIPQLPFLYISRRKAEPSSVVSLAENTLIKTLPHHLNRFCVGSQDGWLIVLDKARNPKYDKISLFNPFDNQELALPLHTSYICNFITKWKKRSNIWVDRGVSVSFKKVIMSCPPASSCAKKNTIAPTVLALFGNFGFIMYTQLGEDEWHVVSEAWDFQEIYCWRGQLVALRSDGIMFFLELNGPKGKLTQVTRDWFGVVDYFPSLFSNKYLVDLDGELLQVWRDFNTSSVRTSSVEVLRLDKTSGNWVPIRDLKGHSLFLGASHSVALSARQAPGLKENSIYFTDDWPRSVKSKSMIGFRYSRSCDIGVFSIEERKFKNCLPYSLRVSVAKAFWVVPPPSML